MGQLSGKAVNWDFCRHPSSNPSSDPFIIDFLVAAKSTKSPCFFLELFRKTQFLGLCGFLTLATHVV